MATRLIAPQHGPMTYTIHADAQTIITAWNADAATYADTPITFCERRKLAWERAGAISSPADLAGCPDALVAVWNGTARTLEV